MAWNQQRSYKPAYNDSRNNSSNYNRAPFNNGNNYNNNRGNGADKQRFKKSGFEVKMMDGKPICSGWLKTKNGLISIYGRPYKKTAEHSSEKSKRPFHNLFVTISGQLTQEIKTSGLFYPDTNRLFIPSQGIYGTPNGGGMTRSGKYVKGAILKIKNRR